MEVDRLKELEKIAEKLGIGQDREVECVSCRLKLNLKDAVILTNKKKVKYLCEKCNEKLEQGELEKKHPGIVDILKELDKQKDQDIQPVPYNPKGWQPVIPNWKPKPQPQWTRTDTNTYTVSRLNATLRLEPNYANKTDTNTE